MNPLHLPRKPFAASLALATTLMLGAGFSQTASAANTFFYGGSAAVVKGNITLLGGQVIGPIQINVVEAGPLPLGGGSFSNSIANIGASALQQVLLRGRVASASTSGGPGSPAGADRVHSEASVLNLKVGVGALLPTLLVVSAEVIESRADAECGNSLQASVSGGSVVTKLFVNGLRVNVSGVPNQTIKIGKIAKIVINEQIKSTTPGGEGGFSSGDITVNAIRIKLLEPGTLLGNVVTGDVHIGQSKASVLCAGSFPT